jgi:hypothetical protein
VNFGGAEPRLLAACLHSGCSAAFASLSAESVALLLSCRDVVQQRDLFPYLSCLYMLHAHVVLRDLSTISRLLELQYFSSACAWRIPGLKKTLCCNEHDANQAFCVNSGAAVYEWVLSSRAASLCIRMHDLCTWSRREPSLQHVQVCLVKASGEILGAGFVPTTTVTRLQPFSNYLTH